MSRSATEHLSLRHEYIDDSPPSAKLGFCLTTDLTGTGRPDVIVGGAGEPFAGRRVVWRARERGLPTARWLRSRLGLDGTNVFWYENPGWKRHEVAFLPQLDVGACLCDLTGDGRQNLVAGQGLGHTNVYWFEYPNGVTDRWKPHLVTDRFRKYHDLTVGDVDDDGEQELVGFSQESDTVFYYDIPADPYRSPWPDSHCHIVDDDYHNEGLYVGDIDDDGTTELIAGTRLYEQSGDGWIHEDLVTGWENTRVAVGDVNDDGSSEILIAEGDSPHLGSHPGRLGVIDPSTRSVSILEADLFCPHTLNAVDLTGAGYPGIYVAEMGLGKNSDPTHLFYRYADGEFTRNVVARGVETHEATVADLTGDGVPDIVGKSYTPDHHVDAWYNDSV